MIGLYPIHVSFQDRPVLVVGGGKVARRKVETLVEFGAKVTVASPAIQKEIEDLPGVRCIRGTYSADLLDGHILVFACTDDRAVNRRVADDARRAGLWCNIADDPEGSDFHVPAHLLHGRVCLAVSTAGASPRLAAHLRDICGRALPANVEEMAEAIADARLTVLQAVPNPAVRAELLRQLVSDESLSLLAAQGRGIWQAWFDARLRHVQSVEA